MTNENASTPEEVKPPDVEVAPVNPLLNSQLIAESDFELEDPIVAPPVVPVVEKKKVENCLQQSEFSHVPEHWSEQEETVSLPSNREKESLSSINDAPNQSLVDSKINRDWAAVYTNGLGNVTHNNAYENTLDREGTEFRQGIKSEGPVISGAYPKLKAADNQALTGERATMRLLTHLGIGNNFTFPLYHTGIWLTIRAPSEGDLLELNRQIASDKIMLGRKSYGLVLSNEMSYMADRLVNFVLEHIYETSLQEAVDLKTVISSHDIPTLLWGLASSIYPRGFQYNRACVVDPTKCNNIVKERLNLSKLQWVDTAGLTTSQVLHLTNRRRNSMTLESVNAYKAQLLATQKREITLNEGSSSAFKVLLKVPTVAEYVDSGSRWISNIVSMVNKSMGVDVSNDQRDNYILRQGQATLLRLYTHWVESIDFGTNTVDDVETLEANFDAISPDDKLRDDFLSQVKKYIDDSCIAVIGIPIYDCPVCNKVEPAPLPRFTSIVPIDTYEVFFTLLVQKLQRLAVR